MRELTQAQYKWLWNQANSAEVRDWLFEIITEAGFDVREDTVVKLA